MKKLLLILLLIYTTDMLYSQCDNRYQSEIFSSVNVTTVNYSDVYFDNFHEMDIYKEKKCLHQIYDVLC